MEKGVFFSFLLLAWRKDGKKTRKNSKEKKTSEKNSHMAGLPTSYLASPIGIDNSVLKKVCPETSSHAPSRGISLERS